MTPPDDAGLVERLRGDADAWDEFAKNARLTPSRTAKIERQAADRIEALKGEVDALEIENAELRAMLKERR